MIPVGEVETNLATTEQLLTLHQLTTNGWMVVIQAVHGVDGRLTVTHHADRSIPGTSTHSHPAGEHVTSDVVSDDGVTDPHHRRPTTVEPRDDKPLSCHLPVKLNVSDG